METASTLSLGAFRSVAKEGRSEYLAIIAHEFIGALFIELQQPPADADLPLSVLHIAANQTAARFPMTAPASASGEISACWTADARVVGNPCQTPEELARVACSPSKSQLPLYFLPLKIIRWPLSPLQNKLLSDLDHSVGYLAFLFLPSLLVNNNCPPPRAIPASQRIRLATRGSTFALSTTRVRMDAETENIRPSSFIFDVDADKLTHISKHVDHKPELQILREQDINATRSNDVASRPMVDTPPPSSPNANECDDAPREERSSSITALFSSSPFRSLDSTLNDQDASLTADPAHRSRSGSSPVKPYRRISSGRSLDALATSGDLIDLHAGLRKIADSSNFTEASHVLKGSFTHALLLGRSKPLETPRGTPSAAKKPVLALETFCNGIGSKPLQHVPLPNSARHISRRHAIVEWLPFSLAPRAKDSEAPAMSSGGFVVRILGQNGLIVDGKRRREGHVLRIIPGKSIIDFFGVKARFEVDPDAFIGTLVDAASQKSDRTKVPRLSGPTSNGSSPLKRQDAHRTASRKSLGSTASQDAVSQLLRGSAPESSLSHSLYVKRSTISPNSNVPPSPPSSSSPTFPGRERDAQLRSSPDADEPDARSEDLTSPSLGRSRLQYVLTPKLGLSAALTGLRAVIERSSRMPKEKKHCQQAQLKRLMLDADDSPSECDEEADSRVPKRIRSTENARKIRKSTDTLTATEGVPKSRGTRVDDLTSDAESDLTPLSSPVMLAQKERVAKPMKSRGMELARSQVIMRPPKVPATASIPAGAANTAGNGASLHQADNFGNMLRDEARACVARLAATYDLEGLLASAIVFHRTATISASEAVRSVLASNQGLMRGEIGSLVPKAFFLAHGEVVPGWGAPSLLVQEARLSASAAAERWSSTARRAWTERLELVLQSKRMFGQIQRAGKDASGNSLECWYYYDKDGDEDRERAANLGALVKPIRGALKTHKPIFWKKSRSIEEDASAATMTAATLSANNTNSAGLNKGGAGRNGYEKQRNSRIGPATLLAPSPAFAAGPGPSAPKTKSSESSPSVSPRLQIDERRIWEETQPEEREKTWDRLGDLDWTARSSSPSITTNSGTVAQKRKRKSIYR